MTLAQAAQKAIELGGKYDGHELPEDINAVHQSVGDRAGRSGADGRGARHLSARRRRRIRSSAAFAEVEVDVETGKYHIVDYLAVADVGTVIHPHALGGQVLGRSMLGIGHAIGQKWVYDQHYGVPLAQAVLSEQAADDSRRAADDGVGALDIPDPETPVGARGIGEPPVAAGCCAVLNAMSDAVGDDVFRRAPVMVGTLLAALDAGQAGAGTPHGSHLSVIVVMEGS